MEQCVSCDHALGAGRFCVNCGHPVGAPADALDWRTSTVERPALRPTPPPPLSPRLLGPPPAAPPPSGPRFPLYADEVGAAHRSPREPAQPVATPTPTPTPVPVPVPLADPDPSSHRHRHRHRSAVPWLVGALLVALMAGGGVLLLVNDGDDAESAADQAPAGSASPPLVSDPSAPPSTIPPVTPSPKPPGKPPAAQDVTSLATVTAPRTAAPSRDTSGNAVRYEPTYMLDGVSDTAWRMPGDGSGSELVIVLPTATRVTRLGLVNGYAKRDADYDGYPSNRRVTAVEWILDDGTVVPQTLDEVRTMQTVDVDRARTTTIRLRILSVSSPGTGPSGRDFTAISDLRLAGVPS